MVRTWSATLRRSFAQLAAGIASLRTNDAQSRTALIAASLVQSVLLAVVAITIAIETPDRWAGVAQLFGALAVMSSAYVGYAVLSESWFADAPTSGSGLIPAEPASRGAASGWGAAGSGHDAHASEQLLRLKASISHELRTPLNAVIGFSDMMHREVLGPVGNDHYREYAAHIRLSAERFQIATQNSLAVTELLTSSRIPMPAVVQLGGVVADSLDTFQRSTACTEPTWHFSIDPDVRVLCDPHSLDDALAHLWTVGRSLALSSATGSQPDCRVCCRVVDGEQAELRFTVQLPGADMLANDGELAPGAELGVFLARFAVESAGGAFLLSDDTADTWCAIVRLPTSQA
jgi:signal transduction histidine kinase